MVRICFGMTIAMRAGPFAGKLEGAVFNNTRINVQSAATEPGHYWLACNALISQPRLTLQNGNPPPRFNPKSDNLMSNIPRLPYRNCELTVVPRNTSWGLTVWCIRSFSAMEILLVVDCRKNLHAASATKLTAIPNYMLTLMHRHLLHRPSKI